MWLNFQRDERPRARVTKISMCVNYNSNTSLTSDGENKGLCESPPSDDGDDDYDDDDAVLEYQ